MYIAYTENLAAAAKTKGLAVETAYQAIIAQGNIHMAARARGVAVEILQQEARVAATHQVIAAERELQASSNASKATLANPWVLAAMAAVALGYGIYKLIKYQTDLEKSTSKLNVQIANEKDKAADLFAELNHATKSTDEWKKAKAGILEQYGTYLTEQQKELLGTKNQAEAQDAVNRGIEENISLKVKQESLDAVRGKYNEMISGSVDNLGESAKSSLDRDASAKFNKDLKVQVELIKYEVDPAKKAILLKDYDTLISELKSKVMKDGGILKGYALTNIEAYASQVKSSLIELSGETVAINKAFAEEGVKSDAKKVDPILTTYQAQLDVIKGKKAIAEKELAELKIFDAKKEKPAKQAEIDMLTSQLNITKDKVQQEAINKKLEIAKDQLTKIISIGVDPTKAITAKQGELDAYNKQLGIKESEAKKSEIEKIKKLMETAHGRTLAQLTERLRKLEEIKKMEEDIASGTKMKGVTDGVNQSDKAGIISEFTSAVDPSTKKDIAKDDKQIKDAEEKMRLSDIAYQKDKDHQQWLYDDNKKKKKEQQEDLIQGFNDVADMAGMLADAIGDSNVGLANMLGSVSNLAGSFAGVMKGDPTAILSSALQIYSLIQTAGGDMGSAERAAGLEKVNKLLKEQSEIVALSERKGGELNKRKAELEAIKAKGVVIATNQAEAEGQLDKIRSEWWNISQVIFANRKKLKAEIAQDKLDTEQNKKDLAVAEQAYIDALAPTENVIADSIAESFMDANTSVDDFADYTNKILKEAIIDAFKSAILGPEITKGVEMLAGFLEDGVMTEDEIKQWTDFNQKLKDDSKTKWDALTQYMPDVFGTDTARTASSKGFTTMSQDSADELNGRFTAMQGHTFSINEGVKILTANSAGILKHLAGIETNTGRLESMQADMSAMKLGIETINLKGITLKK